MGVPSTTPEEMSFNVLDTRFTDALAAAEYLESIRWPDGPVCPHCGESERKPYFLKNQKRRLWKCAACRKQFTVMVGTIFESSHIPLNKWLLAFYLLCSSKKGMSAHQLHRMLGVTYKSAWFMAHRIREAMTQAPFASRLTGTVEVDETYIGGKPRRFNKRQHKPLDPKQPDPRQKRMGRATEKTPVVALVQRDGMVYSQRVANVTGATLKGVIRKHVDPSATIMTDAFKSYSGLANEYAEHFTVNHLDEYVRGEIHTNTAKTSSRSSSAGSTVCTTTSASRTFRATSQSSTSATTIEPRTGSMMQNGPARRFRRLAASASATLRAVADKPKAKRAEPLRIPLPVEEALLAALETPPPDTPTPKRKRRKKKTD
jgi:transposase-like protein